MIKLSLSSFVSLCLFVSVVGLLGVWLLHECRRRIKSFRDTKGNVWHCSICTNVYVDKNDEALSLCPKCGSYNSRSPSSIYRIPSFGKKNTKREIRNTKKEGE